MKKWFLRSFLGGLFLIFGVALYIFPQIPSDREIKGCLVTRMYHVKLCPGSNDYVPLKSISPAMQQAVVMSEDTTFWSHQGFDWDEMEKSARQNWKKGEYKRGGSTITQQLAKNMFLSKDKSLLRKGIEALITLRLEKVLKKKDILERYLNVVQFGKDLFGIKAAAQFYFKKSPADLDLTEAAFLTMLLPSPEKYARSFSQKSLTPFARGRIERIIGDLAQTGKASPEEASTAIARMDHFFAAPRSAPMQNPEATNGESATLETPPELVIPDSEFDPQEGDQ